MSTLPKIKINRGAHPGNQVLVSLPDISNNEKTFLSADEAAAQTSLSVLSGANFAANEYVLVGVPGSETAEIRLVASQSATAVVTDALTYAHSKGEPITFIPFNQIEIDNDTDSAFGSPTTATIAIRPDALDTFYEDIDGSATDYYRARFKHAQGTRYSSYSDSIIATGYEDNTVFSIKSAALTQLGEKIEGIVTDEFLTESLQEGRREFDQEIKRWSFRTAFNSDIGDIVEGQYSVSVPSTLRNPDTNQNILGLRIGNVGTNIQYLPLRRFQERFIGSAHTTVATQPSVGAVTIVLTDTNDFDESGTIKIAGDDITYTANDESTNTLSGIPDSGDGSITVGHAVGVDAWQNISYGLPQFYTIYEDTIRFDLPFHEDYIAMNIFMDYYRTLPSIDSDADTLDEPEYDMFVSWLKWKIKSLKSQGKLKVETDSDYLEWTRRKFIAIKKDTTGQEIGFSPDIAHLIDID